MRAFVPLPHLDPAVRESIFSVAAELMWISFPLESAFGYLVHCQADECQESSETCMAHW